MMVVLYAPIAHAEDDQLGCWVSDAEVAQTQYAAFTSKKKELHVTAQLIVRRAVARQNGWF